MVDLSNVDEGILKRYDIFKDNLNTLLHNVKSISTSVPPPVWRRSELEKLKGRGYRLLNTISDNSWLLYDFEEAKTKTKGLKRRLNSLERVLERKKSSFQGLDNRVEELSYMSILKPYDLVHYEGKFRRAADDKKLMAYLDGKIRAGKMVKQVSIGYKGLLDLMASFSIQLGSKNQASNFFQKTREQGQEVLFELIRDRKVYSRLQKIGLEKEREDFTVYTNEDGELKEKNLDDL